MGGALAITAVTGTISAIAEAIKAVNQTDLELIRTGTPEAAEYAKKLIEQRTNLLESGDLLHDLFEPIRNLIRKLIDDIVAEAPPT